MKHGKLRSIGHNLADSLSSGLCFVVGHYQVDVYGEAARTEGGVVAVDFLSGKVIEGTISESLAEAVSLFHNALPDFCAKNGASLNDFRELTARFSARGIHNGFSVTVEDVSGRRSITEYMGYPGARPKVLDVLGQIRRKSPKISFGERSHRYE